MTDKNTSTMDNLIFKNLQWHFGTKKMKAKLTNRITGKVEIKLLCRKKMNYQLQQQTYMMGW